MTCQHLIAICSKTHLPCPHVAVNGTCDEAACTNAVVPSWEELLDIYKSAVHPTVMRFNSIRYAFLTLTRTLGTTLDAKIAVTDEQIDAAYAKLKLDHEPETIDGIFCAFKACTSSRREIRIEYRKRGKQIPNIDTPSVEKKQKPIVQLTEAQRVAVRERLALLRVSKKPSERARFLWLWFAWHFGMRPIDIETIKWDCLKVHSNGAWWLDYIPTKTAKTGKHAGCKLTETQVEEIRPFVGEPDAFVIPRYTNRRAKNGRKLSHGEYVGRHLTLRRFAIDFMKSLGVEDRKPQYALRKDCSQRTIRERGILHEAQMLGHTPRVAMRNYTDLSKLELKEGL